ncbi:hypothetical protein, partial [Ralstonia pseudosolanacearum]|uniref:hypothetical protein n=1 Tax=Ralstonia pseudosolanacearum TaxID=1310165 RepID=UPI002003A8C3
RFVRACSTASRLSLARTPSVSPEFKIIGGPVSSNSIYATTPTPRIKIKAHKPGRLNNQFPQA